MNCIPLAARALRLVIAVLWFGLCGSAPCFAQTQMMSLSSTSSVPGGIAVITLSLATAPGAEPASAQWTLTYPPSAISSVTVTAGAAAAAAGKSIICSASRCLLYGTDTQAIQNGTVAIMTLQIAGSNFSSFPVKLVDALASSSQGDPIPLLTTDAAISINVSGTFTQVGSMAHVASGGGWETTFAMVNLGGTPASGSLSFYGDDGDALALPFTFPQTGAKSTASTITRSVNPNSLFLLDANGPSDAPTSVGWSEFYASGNVSGFAVFSYDPSGQEAVVPLEVRSATSFLLAFDNTATPTQLRTGAAIANSSTLEATVSVKIRDDKGVQIGTRVLNLPARGHTSFMLDETYAETVGRLGTIEFGAPPGGKISILGLRANGAAFSTLPALTGIAPGGGSFAHVAAGNGWQTSLTLINTGAATTQTTLTFLDDSGNPLSLPLELPQTGETLTSSTLTRSINPGASLQIQSSGSAGQTTVGSAQVATAGSVGGLVAFRFAPTGQEAIVPMESRNATSYLLLFDNSSGLATGLALAGVSNQSLNVPVVFRDDSGAQLGMANIAVPTKGHTSFVLNQNYPVTMGKRGTVEFFTPLGGQISVIGLRAHGNAFTTIPPMVR